MARAKKSAPDGGGSWMDTYGDLVTLLLCFFVLLFSQSTIEQAKWEKLIQAFQNPTDAPQQIVINPDGEGDMMSGTVGEEDPTVEEEIDFSELAEVIKDIAESMGQSENVTVEAGDNMMFIRFKNDLLFDPNSSILKNAARNFLSEVGSLLKDREEEISVIRVNGHTATASVSGGQYINDRLLSSDRANAVLMYLEDVMKIDPKKLISMGYGRNYPIAPNDTEEGRAQNRRVELMILGATGGAADEYWSSIFSGNMSVDTYEEVYEALNKLPSLETDVAEDGMDYVGLGGTTDAIDKIDLNNAGQ